MIYVIVWSVILAASLCAIVALVWAVHTGQFRRLDEGATSIFDEPEAEREEADRFPHERSSRP